MNYKKMTKSELIKLLERIDSSVLSGLEYCKDEEKSYVERFGYAKGTLKYLNELLNETNS